MHAETPSANASPDWLPRDSSPSQEKAADQPTGNAEQSGSTTCKKIGVCYTWVMNVTISKTVEKSLNKMPSQEREVFVNSALLVALTNQEITQERKTVSHQKILTEAKVRADQNTQSHEKNVDQLKDLLIQANSQ
jgi:hypothetical protein